MLHLLWKIPAQCCEAVEMNLVQKNEKKMNSRKAIIPPCILDSYCSSIGSEDSHSLFFFMFVQSSFTNLKIMVVILGGAQIWE